MDPNFLFSVLVQLLLLWLAISLHEWAHAWVASLCGDPTARELGRVSLNPLRHLDPVGSLLFPTLLVLFGWPLYGWGRSTPVQEKNLRNPVRDSILVLAAGPAANLLVALAATVAVVVMIQALGAEGREAAFQALFPPTGAAKVRSFPVMFTLMRLAFINVGLVVFNLIPLPPLDGGQIAIHLLPPDWAARLAAVRPYGFMIGVLAAVGLVPLLTFIVGMVINFS
jgi:Zn-dependent protease